MSIIEKNIEDSLEKLGIQKNSGKVYIELLKLGSSKAQVLIKETGLHRMSVYNALEDLSTSGLVTVTHKNNARIFHPENPTKLISRAKDLEIIAQQTSEELKKIQSSVSEPVVVKTLTGKEGFRKNLEDVIDSAAKQKEKEIYIIGGAKDTDFYEATADWYQTYIQLLKKKKVRKRLLAPESYSSEFKKKFVSENNTELRTLTRGLSSPSYTRITKEMVAIELYEPKLTVIQISSPAVAQTYLDYFELLWENSKHYNPIKPR